jgi:hypothetical protein
MIFVSVLYLYLFFLIVLALSFVLTVQHTHLKYPCPPAGFKPATIASDRLQTLALDRSATGIRTLSPSNHVAAD